MNPNLAAEALDTVIGTLEPISVGNWRVMKAITLLKKLSTGTVHHLTAPPVNRPFKQRHRPVKGSSSRFKGVNYIKRDKCWQAYMCTPEHRWHLGCYHEEEDAARAYNLAAKRFFGDAAILNDVPDKEITTRIVRKKKAV